VSKYQKSLKRLLAEWEKNGCGDGGGPGLPVGAYTWGDAPVPSASDWREGGEDSSFMKYMEQATGLTGTALLIYIGASEGSRIFFPPRNLVPVP